MGAQVIALDVSLERRKLAREFGANEVIHARSNNPVEAIRELTRGEGARARALPGRFEPFYPPARLTTREKGKHLMQAVLARLRSRSIRSASDRNGYD